jgi:hypothetical protein
MQLDAMRGNLGESEHEDVSYGSVYESVTFTSMSRHEQSAHDYYYDPSPALPTPTHLYITTGTLDFFQATLFAVQ